MAPPVSTIVTTQRIALTPPQVTPGGTFSAVWAVDVVLGVDGTSGRGRARTYTEDSADDIARELRRLGADGQVRAALAALATHPSADGRLASWREAWLGFEGAAAPGSPFLALGALDEAVWDVARHSPGPRGRGGGARDRPRVGVYWSGLWLHSTLDELAAETRWAADQGFDAAKLRLDGQAVGDSVDRVRAVLGAAPPGRWLALELACSGTPGPVEELAEALDPTRIVWIEDPLPATELAATADLVRRLPVPVALGEDCWGRGALAERVAATGAQVPIVDLGFVGGPTAMQLVLEDGAFGRADLGVHIDAVTGADVAAVSSCSCRIWLEAFAWWGPPSLDEVARRAADATRPGRTAR